MRLLPCTYEDAHRLVNAGEKECVKVLPAGMIAPLLVFYSYERLPVNLVKSTPNGVSVSVVLVG